MSRRRKVLCGTPTEECTGSSFVTDQKLSSKKAHPTHEEAFDCHASYLVRAGFKRLGMREFQSPDGGPIRMLTKKSRFGGRLRSGKEGTRYQPERGAGLIIG